MANIEAGKSIPAIDDPNVPIMQLIKSSRSSGKSMMTLQFWKKMIPMLFSEIDIEIVFYCSLALFLLMFDLHDSDCAKAIHPLCPSRTVPADHVRIWVPVSSESHITLANGK